MLYLTSRRLVASYMRTSYRSGFRFASFSSSLPSYNDKISSSHSVVSDDIKKTAMEKAKLASNGTKGSTTTSTSTTVSTTASTSSTTSSNDKGSVSINTSSSNGSTSRSCEYDLVVIGSGPAGQKCAIDAAKRRKRVALVDKSDWIGGVCVHTGTIPSKTFREAILHLSGYNQQGFYGKSHQSRQFTVADLMYRVGVVEKGEMDVVKDQLARNNVHLVNGHAKFIDEHTISVESTNVGMISSEILHSKNFQIAVGTTPARRSDVIFDGSHVFDSDQILHNNWVFPRELIVVGAGVIGMEYASMINVIPGSNVTVIDEREEVLPFVDREVTEALMHEMRQTGARFLLGECVKSVSVVPSPRPGVKNRVVVELESGKLVNGGALLYAVGRSGATEGLGLENVGVKRNKRGLIEVNDSFQTNVPHIYAGGDCIGFPALASTSMEQGRLASCHMWGQPEDHRPELFPYGIYTIPEVSMVGKTEKQLTDEKIPYEVGIANYEELAKGQMLGSRFGFLKLIFCPKTLQLLGVHCIGEGATEIVHIGQAVLAMGGTIEYFKTSVFNYPTLAEAYRTAAFQGLRKL